MSNEALVNVRSTISDDRHVAQIHFTDILPNSNLQDIKKWNNRKWQNSIIRELRGLIKHGYFYKHK